MYYSLTSRRKIGDLYQCISSYQSGFTPPQTAPLYSVLKGIHNNIRQQLADYDGEKEVGATQWLDILSHDDGKSDSSFLDTLYCDYIVTLYRPADTTISRFTSVKIVNTALADFGTELVQSFRNLTGLSLGDLSVKNGTYIINVIANINTRSEPQ